jgi:hypothetical protein
MHDRATRHRFKAVGEEVLAPFFKARVAKVMATPPNLAVQLHQRANPRL